MPAGIQIQEPNGKMPGMPTDKEINSLVSTRPSLYSMHYRHGMNSKLEKNFEFVGDLFAARKRAEDHCAIMGYKLIWVRPLVVDLEAEEAQQLGRPKV